MTLTAFPPSTAVSSTARRERPMAPAKVRILETALRLFYDEGIRATGVDLLIAESSVTKATFYKHFGSKDRLVLDYVEIQRQRGESALEDAIGDARSAAATIGRVVDMVESTIESSDYRGCPFMNAAAEYPDRQHPVRQVTAAYTDHVSARLATVFTSLGHPLPGAAADGLTLAINGAYAWSYMADDVAARAGLRRVAERLVAECGSATR
ncbi:TetR family transcriptional regulator [Microcella putealis]|uniref:TetR family transcriptional regulator n=1 Tax=Microcella putealis TaxID=337005 RepID=A0A4Q7LT22_9MICO|nr:TetR/AcrR family transcriptional regulator [Microcella putealis]RZS57631.1 TetR family transcriptional regulator [Microcella putealis]TQM24698.1 TetR family transcriptional regulator [Microcella putealis]